MEDGSCCLHCCFLFCLVFVAGVMGAGLCEESSLGFRGFLVGWLIAGFHCFCFVFKSLPLLDLPTMVTLKLGKHQIKPHT